MSIKSKLLTALSLILLAAFLATSLINYTLTREAIREELLNSALPLTGKNIYSEIHAAMMKPILMSSSMANDTFLKDWVMDGEQDSSEITKYLNEISSKHEFITAFFVSASSDKYYYQGGTLKEISPRDPADIWYYAFTQSGKTYELNVDANQAEKNMLTIFINYRVEDANGRLLGVTGVGVNMDNATALLMKTQNDYNRNVYLVDQDGLIQVHADKSLITNLYITETKGIDAVADYILKPRKDAVNFEYDSGNDHILLSARYIPEFKWHLIVEQDEGEALVTARSNLVRTLAIGLGASILIIFLCVITVNHFQSRLERMAKTDPLTGAANRRALEDSYILSAYKADRYEEPFSIIILDLDGFKEINDTYGHLEGDNILKSVAQVAEATIRPTDLLARWGGDEFIVLMDGTTKEAQVLADRIRAAMKSASDIPVSFSCGTAEYVEGDDLGSLTQRADKAMYKAKAKGGDFVVCC